jgi:hypothetical protein
MKKTLLLTIAIMISIVSFASIGEEEASYENAVVSYNVEKATGQVLINLDLKNIDQYAEIRIVRSDNPVSNYRQVKLLTGDALKGLLNANTLVDKYPLPSKSDAYYKLVTIDTYGVQKSYPSVKLN